MAKIYNDFQSANLMSFAKSFARLNGQPLDKSEIWYSLAEAQDYAATDAAYVGQILAVIDSDNNIVVFYGIQDVAGTLKEVGSAPIGDNLSIEIVDGAVQLKNFGKGYHKYVPAVKDEISGEITTPSTYEYVEDDFIAGLEPRVVLNKDGKLEIAWYEPSEETIDGVNAKVESVTNTVETLEEIVNAEGGLVDQVSDLQEQVGQAADDTGNAATGLFAEIERIDGELDKKANAEDVYTKTETDTAIATAIANVDHLKREIVAVLPSVEDADENTIYMIPNGLQEDDNKYYEWILIDGVFEQVGSWEVDLKNYATKDDVSAVDTKVNTLTQTVTDNKNALDEDISDLQQQITDEIARAQEAEEANATEIAKKANAADVYTKSETDSAIADAVKSATGGESASDVLIALNNYKKAVNTEVWGSEVADESLTSTPSRIDILEEAVSELQNEEPYISSVTTDFQVIDGQLVLNELPASKIAGLTDMSNNVSILQTKVQSLEDILNGYTDEETAEEVPGLITELEAIKANYLTIVDFNNTVGNLETLLVENTTIVERIDEIEDALKWQDMPEPTTT